MEGERELDFHPLFFHSLTETNKEKTKMLTADATWLELRQKDKFNNFYQGFTEYLKSKLTLIGVEGSYSYYTCGHHHDHSDPDWKPFENLEKYCEKKGFDFYEVKDLIEKHIEKKIICECQLVNNERLIKRIRLRKSFGINLQDGDCTIDEDRR